MRYDLSECAYFLSNENDDQNNIATFSGNKFWFKTDKKLRRLFQTDSTSSPNKLQKIIQSISNNKSNKILQCFYKIKVFFIFFKKSLKI